MTHVQLKEMRLSARQSRRELGELLGYTANYIYLLESGRKPITDELARRLQKTVSIAGERLSKPPEVGETKATYECRIPATCDLPAQLDQMQAELHDLKGKMDTLLGLLGGPLRSAVGLERDDKDRAG